MNGINGRTEVRKEPSDERKQALRKEKKKKRYTGIMKPRVAGNSLFVHTTHQYSWRIASIAFKK